MKSKSKTFKRLDTKVETTKTIPFKESTLETIDGAIFNWLKDDLELKTVTHEGFQVVPVIWAGSERSFNVKDNRKLRDQKGMVIYPIITLSRNSIEKDPTFKGTAWANIPADNDYRGGSIEIARVINQDKTSNFANADAKRTRGQLNFPRKNQKIVYSTKTIPMPVYLKIMYKIEIRTNFQQQMNDLVTPFITKPGGINYQLAQNEGHRFEVFIQPGFKTSNLDSGLGESERLFTTTIDLKVLGYLIGDGKNQITPKVVIRENAVEVKLPRTRRIVGEEAEHVFKKFFRE